MLVIASAEFASVLEKLPADKSVIDLVGTWNRPAGADMARLEAYEGIAW